MSDWVPEDEWVAQLEAEGFTEVTEDRMGDGAKELTMLALICLVFAVGVFVA